MKDLAERLRVARAAAECAGAALRRLPRGVQAKETGDQLKTAADEAAEGWVVGLVRGHYPGERILAEEDFDARGGEWDAPAAFWTVDALDGSRSFVEGFDGFCVQIAYIVDGAVQVGVVHEPILDRTYYATAGGGAWRQTHGEEAERIVTAPWPARPRFVDSTRPKGVPGQWFDQHDAEMVELGSIGLKICRIADGTADVYLKELGFKLWDVAPGVLVLAEAGGRLGLWDGTPIPFAGTQVRFRNVLAASAARFEDVRGSLAKIAAGGY